MRRGFGRGPRVVVAPVGRRPMARGPVAVVRPRRRVFRPRPVVIRPRRVRWIPMMATFFMVKKAVDHNKVTKEAELSLAKGASVETVAVIEEKNSGDLIVAAENHHICDPDKHRIVDLPEWTEIKFKYDSNGMQHVKTCYADRKCTICEQHFFCYDDPTQAPSIPSSSQPPSQQPSYEQAAPPYPGLPQASPTTYPPYPGQPPVPAYPPQQAYPTKNPYPSQQQPYNPYSYPGQDLSAEVNEQKTPTPSSSDKPKFCTVCGSKRAGGNFCSECGHKAE
eukprot:CFRG8280T1